MGGIYLLLVPVALSAKSINYKITPTPIAEQLAHDKDFQKFNIEIFDFVTKLKSSNSSEILKKIVSRTASNDEKNLFSNKMGYNNFEELDAFMKKTYILKENFRKSFPVLAQEKENKQIVLSALKIMAKENKNVSQAMVRNCWVGFSLGIAGCAMMYPDQPDDYAFCFSIFLDIYVLCDLLA